MKNHRIEPHRIEGLVTTTAKAFEVIKSGTKGDPRDYARHMHFMVDLLKDLVETAYPIEGEGESHQGGCFQGPMHEFTTITEITLFSVEQFEKAMKNIGKIMKDYKPPKAGEF